MYTPNDVDYLLDDALKEDDVLNRIRRGTLVAGLPAIEVSAQQGRMLETMVRMSRASNVLEVGTLAGYSTVCLARGAGRQGKVTTLEFEPRHAEVARGHLAMAGVSDMVDIIVGDAHKTLARLNVTTLGKPWFDFVFIDADKESNADYLKLVLPIMGPGSTIVVDNVIRDGRVLDPTRRDKLEFIRTVGALAHQGKINASVVQTVGSKGWDGFVLAVVNK